MVAVTREPAPHLLLGLVEGRVGLYHPLGDGVLEGVYKACQVRVLPSLSDDVGACGLGVGYARSLLALGGVVAAALDMVEVDRRSHPLPPVMSTKATWGGGFAGEEGSPAPSTASMVMVICICQPPVP